MPIDNIIKDSSSKQKNFKKYLSVLFEEFNQIKDFDEKTYKVLYDAHTSKWLTRFRFAELSYDQNNTIFKWLFTENKVACIKLKLDVENVYDNLVFSNFAPTLKGVSIQTGENKFIRFLSPVNTKLISKEYEIGKDAVIMYLIKASNYSLSSVVDVMCKRMAVINKQINTFSKTAVINVSFKSIVSDKADQQNIVKALTNNDPIVFQDVEGIQNSGELIAKLRTEYSYLKNELNILLGFKSLGQQEKKEHFIQSEIDCTIEDSDIYAQRFIDSLNAFAYQIEEVFGCKLTLIDNLDVISSKRMNADLQKSLATSLSSKAEFNNKMSYNPNYSAFDNVSSSAGFGGIGDKKKKNSNGFRSGKNGSNGGAAGGLGGSGNNSGSEDVKGNAQPIGPDVPAIPGHDTSPVQYEPFGDYISYPSGSGTYQSVNQNIPQFRRKKVDKDFVSDLAKGIGIALQSMGGLGFIWEQLRKPAISDTINRIDPSITREAGAQFEREHFREMKVDEILNSIKENSRSRKLPFNNEFEIEVLQRMNHHDFMDEIRNNYLANHLLNYQKHYSDLQIEQINSVIIHAKKFAHIIQKNVEMMINREPLRYSEQELLNQFVNNIQLRGTDWNTVNNINEHQQSIFIPRTIKTYKDLEVALQEAITLLPTLRSETQTQILLSGFESGYKNLYTQAVDSFFKDLTVQYSDLTIDEVKYFFYEGMKIDYQMEKAANLFIDKQLRYYGLLGERTNNFLLEGFQALQISPLITSFFIPAVAQRFLNNQNDINVFHVSTENFWNAPRLNMKVALTLLAGAATVFLGKKKIDDLAQKAAIKALNREKLKENYKKQDEIFNQINKAKEFGFTEAERKKGATLKGLQQRLNDLLIESENIWAEDQFLKESQKLVLEMVEANMKESGVTFNEESFKAFKEEVIKNEKMRNNVYYNAELKRKLLFSYIFRMAMSIKEYEIENIRKDYDDTNFSYQKAFQYLLVKAFYENFNSNLIEGVNKSLEDVFGMIIMPPRELFAIKLKKPGKLLTSTRKIVGYLEERNLKKYLLQATPIKEGIYINNGYLNFEEYYNDVQKFFLNTGVEIPIPTKSQARIEKEERDRRTAERVANEAEEYRRNTGGSAYEYTKEQYRTGDQVWGWDKQGGGGGPGRGRY